MAKAGGRSRGPKDSQKMDKNEQMSDETVPKRIKKSKNSNKSDVDKVITAAPSAAMDAETVAKKEKRAATAVKKQKKAAKAERNARIAEKLQAHASKDSAAEGKSDETSGDGEEMAKASATAPSVDTGKSPKTKGNKLPKKGKGKHRPSPQEATKRHEDTGDDEGAGNAATGSEKPRSAKKKAKKAKETIAEVVPASGTQAVASLKRKRDDDDEQENTEQNPQKKSKNDKAGGKNAKKEKTPKQLASKKQKLEKKARKSAERLEEKAAKAGKKAKATEGGKESQSANPASKSKNSANPASESTVSDKPKPKTLWTNWSEADLGSSSRSNKFLRLLGAKNSNAVVGATTQAGAVSKKTVTARAAAMEKQYALAQRHKTGGIKSRGLC